MKLFSISIRVYESYLGSVVSKLQEMEGIDGIDLGASLLRVDAPPLAPKKVQAKALQRGRPAITSHKEVKPKKLKTKNSKYLGKKVNNASGVRGLILTSLKSAPRDGAFLRGLLESKKLSPTNMTGTVAKMVREGLVKSESGQYTLTDRGTKTASANGATQ